MAGGGVRVDAPAREGLRGGALIAVVLAFTLIWFANLEHRRLIHPDEGRYAEIPREMVATGDWLTPRLNGIKYFEKPALQYWITAAAYEAFGIHPWTARIWPALSGFLGVVFLAFVGLRLGGPTLALYSGAALGGCLWYVANGHILTLDMGLTFWMSLGFGAFVLAQRETAEPAETRRWMLLAWAALALAVLSKGLVGVVLPGGAFVTYSLLNRDWQIWKRLHLLGGLALLLVITAPWFVAVSMANREFFDFFFIHEHFTRFLTTEHHRSGGWWYFVPLLLVGILPWLPIALARGHRTWIDSGPPTRFSWQRFALAWAGFIFVFFSASGSKLPSYILPIFPPLALLVAWQLSVLPAKRLARLFAPTAVIWSIIAVITIVFERNILEHIVTERQPLAPLMDYARWIQAGCLTAAASSIGAWACFRLERRTAGALALAFGTLLFTQLAVSGYDTIAESRSSEPLLTRVVAEHGALRKDVPFYSVRMYDQTVPWYLGRTVTQVEHEDELAMGIASEPGRAIKTVKEWTPRWQAIDQAYAIMPPDTFEELRREGLPMRVLGRDPRRVLVARRQEQ